MDTKALAIGPGGSVSKLEIDDPKIDITMYRQGLHAYVEKTKLDEHIEAVKKAKSLRFQLNHFGIERTEEGTFYVLRGDYYRQLGAMFKLPPWESLQARQGGQNG